MILRWSLIIGLLFLCMDSKASGVLPPSKTPLITIFSPTSMPTYSTTSPTLDIAGAASYYIANLLNVKWVNDAGGGGTATGTDVWSYNGIKLRPGQNDITVTVNDEDGNISQASLTVFYTSPPTITAPLPNQRWSNAVFNVTGMITNSVNVLNVMYQLNGSGWHPQRPRTIGLTGLRKLA